LRITTHRFDFDQIEKAYDVFKHGAAEKAMKIIIDY